MSDAKERFCEFYRYRKQKANLSYTPKIRPKTKLDRIHINLAGGNATLPSIIKIVNIFNPGIIFEKEFDYELADMANIKNVYYFMLIINDFSRYRWFFTMKNKTNAL
jgi:hypothetical protein